MDFPVISEIPHIQRHYELVRMNLLKEHGEKGTEPSELHDHRFAEMLALRNPPRAMTDREFFQGMGTLEQQFGGDEFALNELIESAKKQGYTPSPHDVYVDSLAERRGDPKAFVPPSGGRTHVKRVLEERGWACRGAVKTEARPPERDYIAEPKVPLAPDIVQGEIRKRLRDPDNRKKSLRDLKDEVVEKHAYKLP